MAKDYPQPRGVKLISQYIKMRDGVRIAVDLYLPRAARRGDKVPAIMLQTRYQRNVEYHPPYGAIFGTWFGDVSRGSRNFFLDQGYAWLNVDARGSGASFGKRPCPWYEDEVRDGADIIDWIIRQPWSNGNVGSTGISYNGTTAEFLVVNRHPALKAVIPQFSLFDTYTDIAFPGGMHQFDFTRLWNRMNAGYDANQAQELIGMWLGVTARGKLEKRLKDPKAAALAARIADRAAMQVFKGMVSGIRPADGDRKRRLLKKAVAEHTENFNVHNAALEVTFRDDGVISPLAAHLGPMSVDYFSPHTYIEQLDTSGTAIFSYSGWWDMSYQHSAIKRHNTLTHPGNILMIGPWDHAGRHYVGPTVGFQDINTNHNIAFLQFFDHYLKGKDTGIGDVPRVRYYTMGEEKWKSADTWPVPATGTPFYFAPRRTLQAQKPAQDSAADTYRVDNSSGSGDLSRWKSGVGIAIDYSDRRQADRKLLTYDSAPLDRDMEVTGHPVITLYVASSATDGYFIAYLEEVTPAGDVRYVTEGNLRAIHRKVSRARPPYSLCVPYHSFLRKDAQPLAPGEVAKITFDLLPTSYLFRRGSRGARGHRGRGPATTTGPCPATRQNCTCTAPGPTPRTSCCPWLNNNPQTSENRHEKTPLIVERGLEWSDFRALRRAIQTGMTLAAWSPLGPATTSNSTSWPSSRDL